MAKGKIKKAKPKDRTQGGEKLRADRTDFYVCMNRAGDSLEHGYRIQLLPAIFFTCCVMLISRMMQGPSAYAELGDLFFMDDSQITADFYFYYKSIAIYVCAVLVLVFLAYRALTGSLWIRRSRLYLPLVIWLVLTFLSFCFSEYKDISWFGTDGLYGGAAVALCCGLLFFYVFNSVTNERSLKWFVWPLTACLIMAQILGLTQAAGRDFFRTAAGQKMLVPYMMTTSGVGTWDIIDSLAAQGQTALGFVFDTAVYQTFGNPNYVALYTPFVLPLFAFLFIYERKTGKRIIWAVVFGLIFFNLLGSQSTGAIVGAVVALFAACVIAGRSLFSHIKPKLILTGIVIICVLFNIQTLTSDFAKNIVESVGAERVPTSIGEMADGTVNTSSLDDFKRPANAVHHIDRIVTGKERVEITVDGETFGLSSDPESLASAPGYAAVSLEEQPGGSNAITMQLEGENRVWRFVDTADGYRFVNDIGKLVHLRDVEHAGSDQYLFLGTGRVYIWSRTLPLLARAVFLGYGPDTFMLMFPQEDYVGRYNGLWDLRAIIDKPHNLYLNIAFGSGMLSLAAFLAFIIMYIVQSFRLYRHRAGGKGRSGSDVPTEPGEPSLSAIVGRGIFTGLCGFLAAGMFYDGVTSVMPLFWGMLGLGAACNFICARGKRL